MSDGKNNEVLTYPNILVYDNKRYAFDPHKVIYSNPSVNNHGGHVITCKYPIQYEIGNGSSEQREVDIVIQTPEMQTTFGFSKQEHEKDKVSGSISVTFYDDASASAQSFKNVMALWDSLLLQKAKDKKTVWFDSDRLTDEILDYLYNPMVKKNIRKKDGRQFEDSFKAKVPRYGDRFDCEVYAKDATPISLDEITPMCAVRMQCHQTGIWFSDKSFVSSFKTPQVQKLKEGKQTGFAFVGDQ